MNIKITEDDALWEQVFRNEFYKQNMEVSDISHHDMSDICSYQKEEHNSLKGTLPDSGFSVENSSNYFYPRLNISNGNKGSTIFEGGNIFSAKNLDSRSCIECDNPDFQMIDSDEKEWCNFIEHSGQKMCNNYKIGDSGDVNLQEIGHDYNFPQKTILNENNLEENAYTDYDNHGLEADKDNAERTIKRKCENANPKSSLSEKRGGAKLQKTYVSGNKSQSHIGDYPIREIEGGISSRLRPRDSMGGVLGSSIRNPKVPGISNCCNLCGATKRKSKNANHKSNLSKKRNRTKSKKTCIKNNKSQLHIDNHMTFELERDSSCVLGSTNVVVKISGPSVGDTTVLWT